MSACCCEPQLLRTAQGGDGFPPAVYDGYQGSGALGIQYTAINDWQDLIGIGRPLDDFNDDTELRISRNGGSDFTFMDAGWYYWNLEAGWNSLGGRVGVRLIGSVQGFLKNQTSATVSGERGWVLFQHEVFIMAGEIVTMEYATTALQGILAGGSIGAGMDIQEDYLASLAIARTG